MQLRALSIVLVCAALAAGCGAPGPSPEERAALERPARSLEAGGQWREAALAWQQAADTAPGDLGAEYRLNAADALIEAGDGAGAEAVAARLPERLPERLALRRALTLADASLVSNDPVAALTRVGPAAAATDAALLARYRRIRADALELTGDMLGAARERALRGPLLDDPGAIYRNRQQVWELLQQVPTATLEAQPLTPPQVESGWLDLAGIARRHALDVGALQAAIGQWTVRYPGHPAGEQIVPELIESVRVDASPPTRVAVLLPQSGPFAAAAAAVRDGFMAAWFADAPNPNRPEVVLRDTTAGDPALIYTAAVSEGAQFVVGPLTKEGVNAVLTGTDLGMTTLTLNYPSLTESELMAADAQATVPGAVDASRAPQPPTVPGAAPGAAAAGGAPPPAPTSGGAAPSPPRDLSRVYHYALSPEDEAERAAEYAFARGARQAAILVPDGDWGSRIAEAFGVRFGALGGVVVKTQSFPDEASGLSTAVEQLLNIDQSEQRARALRALLAREIKHEPEPRSDLDVIFLAAFPQTARQLRPLLQFHRADHVPVVATSHVYSGQPDPGADQDIEGVVFGDMPWILDPDTYTLPGQVTRVWPSASGAAGRLYAFGADAYALVSGLRELRRDEGARRPGLTGTLSLGDGRRIRRELEWAQIRQGVPVRVDTDPAATGGWGLAAR